MKRGKVLQFPLETHQAILAQRPAERDDAWVAIFTRAKGGSGLEDAFSHCLAIEGPERTVRLIARTFADGALGRALTPLLIELDARRDDGN